MIEGLGEGKGRVVIDKKKDISCCKEDKGDNRNSCCEEELYN
jgi:hypothetical protein